MSPSNNKDSASSENDEEGFQFGPNLESSTEEKLRDLSEQEKERLMDLVRLEPTSNSKLKSEWDIASGSRVYEYLKSELKPFYCRDDDSYIV